LRLFLGFGPKYSIEKCPFLGHFCTSSGAIGLKIGRQVELKILRHRRSLDLPICPEKYPI
jgi:hypothetical protein